MMMNKGKEIIMNLCRTEKANTIVTICLVALCMICLGICSFSEVVLVKKMAMYAAALLLTISQMMEILEQQEEEVLYKKKWRYIVLSEKESVILFFWLMEFVIIDVLKSVIKLNISDWIIISIAVIMFVVTIVKSEKIANYLKKKILQ